MKSIQEIMREKLAEGKRDLERRLAEIRSRPTDIEEDVRCMWRMILES